MSVLDQLVAGLKLTVTGMVTVFILLAFMVLLIGWMSKLAQRLQPVPGRRILGAGHAAAEGLDPGIVSAITAAIHRYRRDRH